MTPENPRYDKSDKESEWDIFQALDGPRQEEMRRRSDGQKTKRELFSEQAQEARRIVDGWPDWLKKNVTHMPTKRRGV